MPSFALAIDPLDEALAGLSVSFLPIVDLSSSAALLHGLECVAAGPTGSPLDDQAALLACARARGVEERVDRARCEHILEAAASLPDQPRLTLGVHASTLVRGQGFLKSLLAQLRELRIDPRRLTLEVLAPSASGLARAVEPLRALGVSVAVEGPGPDCAGLLDCHPDYLKIEPFLVRVCEPAMLDAIVRLARGMGARAIAQGLQDLEQVDAAVKAGISLMQGNYFSEPLAAAAVIRGGGLAPWAGAAT